MRKLYAQIYYNRISYVIDSKAYTFIRIRIIITIIVLSIKDSSILDKKFSNAYNEDKLVDIYAINESVKMSCCPAVITIFCVFNLTTIPKGGITALQLRRKVESLSTA
uniref:Uncharacterized protein n=1 Tax=Glossina brevipalpis TaxID=37001 RepID=A0A1A9WJA9_9MUSC